jgi:flagellar protein FlaD
MAIKIFKNLKKDVKKEGAAEPSAQEALNLDGIQLEDLSEEMIGSILDGEAGAPSAGRGPGGKGATKDEKFNELTLRVTEMEEKFSRLDASLTNIRSESEATRGVLTRLEGDIKELLSVYEVVSKRFNPFIDMDRRSKGEKNPEMKAQDMDGNVYPLSELPSNELEPISLDDTTPAALLIHTGARPSARGQELLPPQQRPQALSAPRPQRPPAAERTEISRAPPPVWTERSAPAPEEQCYEPAVPKRRRYTIEKLEEGYLTRALVMRWIEFLFERLKRNRISPVLEYYHEIGWISEEVKTQIMSYARGEHQDVTSYEPEDHLMDSPGGDGLLQKEFKSIDDWRLSAEDHLRSLLFLEMIAGRKVDKDKLNSLEQEIAKIKKGLEQYHGV